MLKLTPLVVVFLLTLTTASPADVPPPPEREVARGYSPIRVDSHTVSLVTKFAVAEQTKKLGSKIELIAVEAAQMATLPGQNNFAVTLNVKIGEKPVKVKVVVKEQADKMTLVSWK